MLEDFNELETHELIVLINSIKYELKSEQIDYMRLLHAVGTENFKLLLCNVKHSPLYIIWYLTRICTSRCQKLITFEKCVRNEFCQELYSQKSPNSHIYISKSLVESKPDYPYNNLNYLELGEY
jgi:hypothetical protein